MRSGNNSVLNSQRMWRTVDTAYVRVGMETLHFSRAISLSAMAYTAAVGRQDVAISLLAAPSPCFSRKVNTQVRPLPGRDDTAAHGLEIRRATRTRFLRTTVSWYSTSEGAWDQIYRPERATDLHNSKRYCTAFSRKETTPHISNGATETLIGGADCCVPPCSSWVPAATRLDPVLRHTRIKQEGLLTMSTGWRDAGVDRRATNSHNITRVSNMQRRVSFFVELFQSKRRASVPQDINRCSRERVCALCNS